MSLPKGITITHTDGSTYITGTRGRRPSWLETHPDFIKLVNENPVEVVETKVIIKKDGLTFWKWNGGNVQCIVAANDSVNAVRLLGKRFRNFPVSGNEFKVLWKETDALEDVKVSGVYELKNDAWVCVAG
jgi:hypothetical protein